VAPVMANKPLLAKGSWEKSIFHSPLSELIFLNRRLIIFMTQQQSLNHAALYQKPESF